MGNCGSSATPASHGDEGSGPDMQEKQAGLEKLRRSRELDKILREEERRKEKEIKILLLGAGESGKTTILKQMKVIHEVGFSPDELEYYRRQVFQNLWEGMRLVLEAMQEAEMKLGSDDARQHLYLFEESPVLNEGQEFPPAYQEPMKALWQDTGVQTLVKKVRATTLPDSLEYFCSDIDRLFQRQYEPTLDDIFRVRGKTTGITETIFPHKSMTYRMFDVGGQRSERRKWIHCFEGVTAVLFIAAMSGYDQGLIEDRDSNQLREALMLFDSICNSTWFAKASMILLLNKIDKFQEKILYSPIRHHFPDYTGVDGDYASARDYFKKQFMKLNRSATKEVYASYTTAIDTDLLRIVMVTVHDTLLKRNLEIIAF